MAAYVAVITDGKGEIPNGTKIPVPNNKDEGNPTGHGIIFIGVQGQVYCCCPWRSVIDGFRCKNARLDWTLSAAPSRTIRIFSSAE
jgi:hypothetical protein